MKKKIVYFNRIGRESFVDPLVNGQLPRKTLDLAAKDLRDFLETEKAYRLGDILKVTIEKVLTVKR